MLVALLVVPLVVTLPPWLYYRIHTVLFDKIPHYIDYIPVCMCVEIVQRIFWNFIKILSFPKITNIHVVGNIHVLNHEQLEFFKEFQDYSARL